MKNFLINLGLPKNLRIFLAEISGTAAYLIQTSDDNSANFRDVTNDPDTPSALIKKCLKCANFSEISGRIIIDPVTLQLLHIAEHQKQFGVHLQDHVTDGVLDGSRIDYASAAIHGFMDELIGATELADMHNVSTTVARDWCVRGRLPAHKTNDGWKIWKAHALLFTPPKRGRKPTQK